MIKEYLFKVTKAQFVRVLATNKEDAYNLAEEDSFIHPDDAEVLDIELIDVCEEDIDAICDDYKLNKYVEEDYEDYDEEDVDNYFYGS